MSPRQPTIRDVAKRAGVSSTTVSYVFNDRPGISDDTRARVLRAAEALHYSPNALIRSLQQRKTNVIGLYFWPLGSDPMRYINAGLIRGILKGLEDTEYDLLVYSQRAGRFDNANISAFMDRRVDGLIWTPAPIAYGALDTLAEAQFPTVAALYQPVPAGLGHVGVDNCGGVLEAVRHLVRLGHQRIAFSGSVWLADFRERQDGYRQGLQEAGLDAEALDLSTTDRWRKPAEALGLLRERSATAVVCVTDAHAMDLMEAAREAGMEVPRDLSVVGFDDVPAARYHHPALTTVRLPAADVGATAVRLLIALLNGAPASEARTVLPTELMVRESTAPPR